MPELLTKHPSLVLKILNDAGAKCGQSAKQQILTSCPRDQFCALPTGELCVYGLDGIPQMTQLSAVDLAAYTAGVPTMYDWPNAVLLVGIFLVGLFSGKYWLR